MKTLKMITPLIWFPKIGYKEQSNPKQILFRRQNKHHHRSNFVVPRNQNELRQEIGGNYFSIKCRPFSLEGKEVWRIKVKGNLSKNLHPGCDSDGNFNIKNDEIDIRS